MDNTNEQSPELTTGHDNYFRNIAIGYLAALLFYSFLQYMTPDSEPNTTAQNLLYWIADRVLLVSFAIIFFVADKRISHQKLNDQEARSINIARVLSLFYALFLPLFLAMAIPIALFSGSTGMIGSWFIQRPNFDYVYYSFLAICFILSLISAVIVLTVTKSRQEPSEE